VSDINYILGKARQYFQDFIGKKSEESSNGK
jgi:hypothetical protein